MKRLAGLAVLLSLTLPARAAEPLPAHGRYLPLYPGLYLDLGYAQDERDRAFDARGDERASALPNTGDGISFAERRIDATFTWTFPLFEGRDLPFLSSRLHTARVHLNYALSDTEGSLADFIADSDGDLRSDGSGIGDVGFEFGSFLWGGGDWRTRGQPAPSSALLLLGIRVPTGVYDHNAPINAGSNQWALQATLGSQYQPWSGARLEAGYRYRLHLRNHQPQFGGLAPVEQGDDQRLDMSLHQSIRGGWSAGLVFTVLRGANNVYEDPQFAPNAPAPPNGADNFPTPGQYRDDGIGLDLVGLVLEGFISQRLRARLAWLHPLAGQSGEFDLPFTNRRPAGCIPGALGCQLSAGDTVRIDGLGPARAYASDRLQLSLTWQFGQGDAYTCPGCRH
jgi:hypothetical protein